MTEEAPAAIAPSDALEAQHESGGMFGDAQDSPAPEVLSPEPVLTTGEGAEWHWSEGIKGTGNKPEWLKERYSSVSDQAKAYNELEKKFGEFRGAPKDGYALDAITGLDTDSPMLKAFSDTAKELNMSQTGFERVINEYINNQSQMVNVDIKEEKKKLGPQAEAMINQTNQWMKNNLDADTVKTIQSWIHTAEDMKALESLRSFQPLSRSPNAHDMQNTVQYESLTSVKNEKAANWTKYQEDVNYRKSVQQRMIMAENRETAGKKR